MNRFHFCSFGRLCVLAVISALVIPCCLVLSEEASPKPEPATGLSAEEQAQLKKINDENYALFQLLVDTIDQVEDNYVTPISRKELIEAAIQGVVSKLDPYSNYIPEENVDQFRTDLENRFGGLGVHIGIQNDRLLVISPLADSPAYKAGLRPDDLITAIDGKPVEGLSIDQCTSMMKGIVGTSVTLTIERKGTPKPFDVTMERDIIHVATVFGCSRNRDDSWNYWLDVQKKLAYIRISTFSPNTAEDLKAVLKTITEKGVKGLVLDLRFNPGGMMTSAIEICDMFVDEGRIVSTKGRNTKEVVWTAKKPGTYKSFKMAVLINKYSASAAEIVSACLQDHDRAIVIGERSWGKGSVQNVINMDGGALKLTTSGYFRPSGKNIHRAPDAEDSDEWGVTPNDGYTVKLNVSQYEQILWHQRVLDVLNNDAGSGSETTEKANKTDTKDNRSTPYLDAQVKKALEYFGAKK